MDESGGRRPSLVRRVVDSYATFVVVGLLVGAALAPMAFDAARTEPSTVAVVPIEGTIDGRSAAAVTIALQRARQDPSIEAVVLVSNSGGGGASASEELYLQTKRTAQQMPVVASVDASAASGAYYAIAPADYIYAKPSSIVGSIGVLTTPPTRVEPTDEIRATGPDKLTGAGPREFGYILESLQNAFLRAVFEQRGENLTLSRTEVASARIFGGAQAVNNGLADEIGGREAAVREAARRAGLDSYQVEVLRPTNRTARFVSRANYIASNASDKVMIEADYYYGNETDPGLVFLMMPAFYLDAEDVARTAGAGNATNGSAAGVNGTDGPGARADRPPDVTPAVAVPGPGTTVGSGAGATAPGAAPARPTAAEGGPA